MVRFVVYDSTGKILRRGSCREKDLPLQAHYLGENVMEIPKGTEVDNEQFFEVKEGKLQRNPTKEAAVKAARAAATQAARDRIQERRRLLQGIIDGQGTIDQRVALLAQVLMGE